MINPAKSAAKISNMHHTHPCMLVPKSVVDSDEISVTDLTIFVVLISKYLRILASNIFRMSGMAILIFIVF